MDLSDLSRAKRTEIVYLALDWVLQDLTGPTSTREVARRIAKRLSSREAKVISQIIVKAADRIPEAARGSPFTRYGKSMRPVIWWPKGQLPDANGITRLARRAALKPTDAELYEAYCRERGLDPETGLETTPETENWSV